MSKAEADGAIDDFYDEYRSLSGLKIMHEPTQEDFYGPNGSVAALGYEIKGAFFPRRGE